MSMRSFCPLRGFGCRSGANRRPFWLSQKTVHAPALANKTVEIRVGSVETAVSRTFGGVRHRAQVAYDGGDADPHAHRIRKPIWRAFARVVFLILLTLLLLHNGIVPYEPLHSIGTPFHDVIVGTLKVAWWFWAA